MDRRPSPRAPPGRWTTGTTFCPCTATWAYGLRAMSTGSAFFASWWGRKGALRTAGTGPFTSGCRRRTLWAWSRTWPPCCRWRAGWGRPFGSGRRTGSPARSVATGAPARATSTRRSTWRRCGTCRSSSWWRTTATASRRPPTRRWRPTTSPTRPPATTCRGWS